MLTQHPSSCTCVYAGSGSETEKTARLQLEKLELVLQATTAERDALKEQVEAVSQGPAHAEVRPLSFEARYCNFAYSLSKGITYRHVCSSAHKSVKCLRVVKNLTLKIHPTKTKSKYGGGGAGTQS